jgi:hypothetical protein
LKAIHLLKSHLKSWLLKKIAARLNSGKSAGILDRVLSQGDKTRDQCLDSPTSRIEAAEEVVAQFLNDPEPQGTFTNDFWIVLWPSPEREHMSNHVLRDFVSLLKFSRVQILDIENFETVNLEELGTKVSKFEGYGERRIWILSVLHVSSEFQKKLFLLGQANLIQARFLRIVNDLWREYDKHLISVFSLTTDYFIHMDPFGLSNIEESIRRKFRFFPIAGANQELFRPELKDNSVGFSGSITDAYRRKILNHLVLKTREYGIPLKMKVFSYQDRASIPSMAEYARSLNELSYCLDLSRKFNSHNLITGRSLEAFAAGCLLISDSPRNFGPLDLFFERGVHYLNFDSLESLSRVMNTLNHEFEAVQHIQQKGYRQFKRIFGTERLFWKLTEILENDD